MKIAPTPRCLKLAAASLMVLVFSSLGVAAFAKDVPLRRQAVVELFTSQGCSSCPPADHLLGELARDPNVIALTLPVDYWDYLGWKDTLAKPAFSARQRGYAEAQNDKQVYTPQIMVDGYLNCIGSREQEVVERIAKSLSSAAAAAIEVKVGDSSIGVVVTPPEETASKPMHATLWLIPVRKTVTVTITRGENSGRTSTYSNVAQDVIKVGEWQGGKAHYQTSVARALDNPPDSYVVILQESGGSVPGPILAATKVDTGSSAPFDKRNR